MKKFIFLFCFIFACAKTSSAEETIEQQLDIILEFATELCTRVPLEGQRDALSGEAAVELKGIIKRLAGAGVAGAADFNVESYSGYAQEELLQAVQSTVECRLVIWRDLEARMLSDKQSKSFACEPPGGLFGTATERSNTLNNMGTEHERQGDFGAAADCYAQAVRFHASTLTLTNLASLHWRWDAGDKDLVFDLADRAIGLQRAKIRNIDVPMITRLIERDKQFGGGSLAAFGTDCSKRNKFTSEIVSTDPWMMKADYLRQLNRQAEAAEVYSDVIDIFPPESCVFQHRVGRALVQRGLTFCTTKQPVLAVQDFAEASRIGHANVAQDQKFLTELGLYTGKADGVLGPNTAAAFEGWAERGCPQTTTVETR